jgi:hypothetical protein
MAGATPAADVRDVDGGRRDQVVASIKTSAQEIAERRGCGVNVTMINQDPPATCDARIQAATQAAAEHLGLSMKHLVSRAYHDSLFLARIAPTGAWLGRAGLLGFSHTPDHRRAC